MFTNFIRNTLRILFPIIILSAVRYTYLYHKNSSLTISFGLLCLAAVLGFILYFGIKHKVSIRVLFGYIFLVSLGLRILWFLNIDSIPVSDFGLMFKTGAEFIRGEYYAFQGTNYFARFPHMSLTVMYFGLIQGIFSDPITMTRIINIGFSMLNVIVIFLIAYQIFKDKNKSLWVMLIAGLYPPFIFYNNVFASENLALSLLLLSVLFYLKAVDTKKLGWFICSGIFLSLTHLFRPFGYVLIVGYIMYGFIYYKNDLLAKFQAVVSVVLSSILPFVLVSTILINMGITQYPLWHGTEPLTISVLKGTNISAGGGWNAEDAALFGQLEGDYDRIKERSKKIIIERFQETPPF